MSEAPVIPAVSPREVIRILNAIERMRVGHLGGREQLDKLDVLAIFQRQGCACQCCDHSEGSDCACDCHSSGDCSAALSTPAPQPETELLYALKRIVSCDVSDPDCLHDTWKDLTYRCIEIARAAITKAEAGAAPRRADDKDLPSAQEVLGILKPYADSESGKD